MRLIKSRSGAVLIELALILPLLALLIFGGIEATRFALNKNKLIGVCREISAEVYKNCQSLSPGSATLTCIQTETNNYYAKILTTLPTRHHLAVQVFRASDPYNSTNPCPLDVSHTQTGTPPLATPPTRINTSTGSPLAIMCAANGSFNAAHEVIISTEIHYIYEPIIGFIAQIFGYVPGNMYVVAII